VTVGTGFPGRRNSVPDKGTARAEAHVAGQQQTDCGRGVCRAQRSSMKTVEGIWEELREKPNACLSRRGSDMAPGP
jgi:hypothetical protein